MNDYNIPAGYKIEQVLLINKTQDDAERMADLFSNCKVKLNIRNNISIIGDVDMTLLAIVGGHMTFRYRHIADKRRHAIGSPIYYSDRGDVFEISEYIDINGATQSWRVDQTYTLKGKI